MHGNLLVVTYGDGSIESFDIFRRHAGFQRRRANSPRDSPSTIIPMASLSLPTAIMRSLAMTSSDAAVEVSDISSGQLTQTVLYQLPSRA